MFRFDISFRSFAGPRTHGLCLFVLLLGFGPFIVPGLLEAAETAGVADEECESDPQALLRELGTEIRADRAQFGYLARLRREQSTSLEVVEVTANGPADRAGLEVGDRIVAIDGPLPPLAHDLDRVVYMERFTAGTPVEFGVFRDGQISVLEILPEVMPEEKQKARLHWARVAARRLEETGNLACAEGGAPKGAPTWQEGMEGSELWKEVFARGMEVKAIMKIHRTETGYRFTSDPEIEIPAELGIADLPEGIQKSLDYVEVGEWANVILYVPKDMEEVRKRIEGK